MSHSLAFKHPIENWCMRQVKGDLDWTDVLTIKLLGIQNDQMSFEALALLVTDVSIAETVDFIGLI